MRSYIFFLFVFVCFNLSTAQDFDGIEKSKPFKVENVFEKGDEERSGQNVKIEYYNNASIKYYGSEYFNREEGYMQSAFSEVVKTIYSDSVIYEQTIETKKKNSSLLIKKESYIIRKKIGENKWNVVKIEHGEFLESYYDHDKLISEKKQFFFEGQLHGKQLEVDNGQVIYEGSFDMGIPNGIELSSFNSALRGNWGKHRSTYLLAVKGEWIKGEKMGVWEAHDYLTMEDFLSNREYELNQRYGNKITLSYTSILVKCIETNFNNEINAIEQRKIEVEKARNSEDYQGEYTQDIDTSSLIEIVETREYFPDGNIDEQVYLENRYIEREGYLEEESNFNRRIDGSMMVRVIKNEDYFPKEILDNWNRREDYQEVHKEKLNYQKKKPLLEDGHSKALKQSKLIKIEIFVNGKLYYCEGDC